MMGEPEAALCAPLQQLKNEHVSLRAQMDQFYEIAEDLEYESGPAVGQLFAQLHAQVAAFATTLEAHSRKEESALFPLMARRLGPDDHTIETMEFEHAKAEQHLEDFLTETGQAGPTIAEDDAQSIAVCAVQAHATLTQHFAKEEKMLFPLAEKILSTDDKMALARQMQANQQS